MCVGYVEWLCSIRKTGFKKWCLRFQIYKVYLRLTDLCIRCANEYLQVPEIEGDWESDNEKDITTVDDIKLDDQLKVNEENKGRIISIIQ